MGGRRVASENRAVFARLVDGDGVIVDTRNAFYFGLNRTGAFLWERLAQGGGATMGELADALCERFAVERTEAERDADDFIHRLVEHGLAKLNEAKTDGD
jgi:Coenzyme PQQ synthesis protein D (PqqD)